MNVEDIWESFSGRLLRFIQARVDDNPSTEDILQDVFAKIHPRIHTLHETARLESWVYRIPRNAITDHYRATRLTVELPDTLSTPSDGDDTEAERMLASCLRPMIDGLPEGYRQALILTAYEAYEGLTQQEMGEHLGLSVSGAKSRVQP